MSVQWHTFPDPVAASEACARHIGTLLEEAFAGQNHATLAISGGSTPEPMFRCLAASGLAWARVHVFWVDERSVPSSEPRSNYRMAEEHLLVPARIPMRNVHRIYGEFRAEIAARRYSEEIREFFDLAPGELPHFDVIHRGIGADGHTASLFPGSPLLDDREHLAAAAHVPQLSEPRVTLLPGVLLAARHTVFLVTGEDKAAAVRNVFHEEYDPHRYPAQMASRDGRRVAWFLDKAAAALID